MALQLAQARHLVATQQPVQRGARGRRMDGLARDDKQVGQRQQQGATQLDDDGLLRWAQRSAELVRSVRAVLHSIAVAPLAHGANADIEPRGDLALGAGGRLDLGAHLGRRAGLRMDARHEGCVARSGCIEAITPRRTSLARNNRQLRIGT